MVKHNELKVYAAQKSQAHKTAMKNVLSKHLIELKQSGISNSRQNLVISMLHGLVLGDIATENLASDRCQVKGGANGQAFAARVNMSCAMGCGVMCEVESWALKAQDSICSSGCLTLSMEREKEREGKRETETESRDRKQRETETETERKRGAQHRCMCQSASYFFTSMVSPWFILSLLQKK